MVFYMRRKYWEKNVDTQLEKKGGHQTNSLAYIYIYICPTSLFGRVFPWFCNLKKDFISLLVCQETEVRTHKTRDLPPK